MLQLPKGFEWNLKNVNGLFFEAGDDIFNTYVFSVYFVLKSCIIN